MNKRDQGLSKTRLRSSYLTLVISISLVLFLLGVLGMVLINARGLSDYFRESLSFSIMLDEEVKEAGACGTAAVISPIAKIFDPSENKVYEYCKDGNPGPVTMKLYNKLISIQHGDDPDPYGWVTIVE